MVKEILQLIGIVALILTALILVFFLLDNVHLLSGTLGDYVATVHECFKIIGEATKAFLSGSGLAGEAADLLDSGAEKLRETADELTAYETEATAAPTFTPAPVEGNVDENGLPCGEDPTAEEPYTIVFATAVPAA